MSACKIVELDFAGYKFDEHDRQSVSLRVQFARYPGARSGGGHRGKRWINMFFTGEQMLLYSVRLTFTINGN